MNTNVRKINSWIRSATKSDVDALLAKIILSERQMKVFEMFYLKRQTIGFISDTLFISQRVVSDELMKIRCKISAIISQ